MSTFAFVAGGIGGLAFDHSGNLFVSGGNDNNAIFEVTASGAVSTFVMDGGLIGPLAWPSIASATSTRRIKVGEGPSAESHLVGSSASSPAGAF